MATVLPTTQPESAKVWKPKYAVASGEKKWDMAFLGALGVVFVQYTMIAAMFPVLQPLQLGKVSVGMGLIGMLFATGKRAASSAAHTLDAALIAFLSTMLMATLVAQFPSEAFGGFLVMVQWAIVYLLISRTVTNRWRIIVFLGLYFILNAKLAQHSIRQYFAGVQHFDAEAMAKFGSGAGSVGFFANAGDFGVALATVWPICAYLVFAKIRHKLGRLGVLAFSGLFFCAIIFCGSRGALVGACAAVIFDTVRNPKRLMAPILLAVLLVGAFFMLPEANKARFRAALSPTTDSTSHDRLVLWGVGMKMLRDHPIFGVGPDNFKPVFVRDYSESLASMATVPHSIYVQSLSELGVVGTLPLLAFMGLVLMVNRSTRQELVKRAPPGQVKLARKSFQYCLATGLDLGLVGYAVSGAFITVLYYPHLWLVAALSVGLNTAVHHDPAPQLVDNEEQPRPARPRFAS